MINVAPFSYVDFVVASRQPIMISSVWSLGW